MLRITYLRCEYNENPIGIDLKKPRLSWIIESEKKNTKQTDFQIIVSTDEQFEDIVWDSGVVKSEESVHIKYSGTSLQSCTRYFWKVRITDNYGAQSSWSDIAFFETAFLDSSDWKAKFIAAKEKKSDTSKGRYFRNEFLVKNEVMSARVYATAFGLYELSINGVRIGNSLLTPGWTNYKKRLQYQTYDVTNMLKKGQNALGSILANGWYKGDLAGWINRRNIYGNRVALLLQMHIVYKNGDIDIIISDENWKTSDGPIVYTELYHGETYDARIEDLGWNSTDFDNSKCHQVEIVKYDFSTLVAQENEPVKKIEIIKPVSLITTPRGEKVIDFGQNLTGWIQFSAKGKSGERIILKHAEILDAAGNFYTENLRSAKARIEYILKGDKLETFEPHFTFHGFRYIKIEEYPGKIDINNFKAIVIHSDVEPIGKFSSSNKMLNRLAHNALWSLKGNFIDIPTDCPQRDERMGWTGDAQVFIKTACYFMNTALFFKKWLNDLKSEQLEDGGIPFVIPDILVGFDPLGTGHSATGWSDAAIICPWIIYLFYGDKQILIEQYETMKKWIEYIRSCAGDKHIWNTGFHFGDWLALDSKPGSYFGATPNDLVATAFYAYSTKLFVKIAKVLGEKKDVDKYSLLHANIVRAFQNGFFTPTGDLVAQTQTAHVLALMFDLVKEDHKERTINTLVKLIEENNGHLTTGFLGTPYICHVLSDNGRLDAAYDLLFKEDYPSWLYQIIMGATTIWEHWDGIKLDGTMWSADMNSFNHYAYGSIVDWLFGKIGGLNPDEKCPGYKNIIISPQPGGGITKAEVEYKSMYGLIVVKWQLVDSTMTIDVTVPANTSAHVVLPKVIHGTIKEKKFKVSKSNNKYAVDLGSGEYTIQYKYAT